MWPRPTQFELDSDTSLPVDPGAAPWIAPLGETICPTTHAGFFIFTLVLLVTPCHKKNPVATKCRQAGEGETEAEPVSQTLWCPPPPGSPWTTPESKRNHRKQFPHMLTASHPKHLPPYSLSQERRASAGACSAPRAPELICFFSSLFLPAWFSPRITLQINCVHPRSCLRLYFLGNLNKEAGRRLVPQWRREVVRASPRKGAMRMQRAGWSHRSFKGRMDGNWQLIRYGCGRAEWDKGGG